MNHKYYLFLQLLIFFVLFLSFTFSGLIVFCSRHHYCTNEKTTVSEELLFGSQDRLVRLIYLIHNPIDGLKTRGQKIINHLG